MCLKKTPFYQKHLENKGRIVDFAGWALPVEYESMLKEAKAVRASCGLFDASHMGEVIIEGKGASDFLQRLTSNDIFSTKQGQMQYNLFLNEQGGVIDDFMLYNFGEKFLCVVNASNKDKVVGWLNDNKGKDVEITDKSDEVSLLSVQGPLSCEIVDKAFNCGVKSLGYMNFSKLKSDGRLFVVSRSGYTGEDGFEIYFNRENSLYFWDKLIKSSPDSGIPLCGLGARDILRIEAGYPLYGHEINEDINPYEAFLGWAVKLNKDFVGKDKILKIRNEGMEKKRAGFVMEDRAFPRQGYNIFSSQGEKIGQVCSGAYSPNLNKSIGMAYIKSDFSGIGSYIGIEVRNKIYKAKIEKFPFITLKAKGFKKKEETKNDESKVY